MTDIERIAAIRALHRQIPAVEMGRSLVVCGNALCGQAWPCDTRCLLDALTVAQAEAKQMNTERAHWKQWCQDAETEVGRLKAALTAAQGEVERLMEKVKQQTFLLRRSEWQYTAMADDYYCVFCHAQRAYGHTPDCELAAALAERAEGQPPRVRNEREG